MLLTVTAEGRAVHERALQAVYRGQPPHLDCIPENDQRTMVRTKQTMLTNLVADPDLARRLLSLSRDED